MSMEPNPLITLAATTTTVEVQLKTRDTVQTRKMKIPEKKAAQRLKTAQTRVPNPGKRSRNEFLNSSKNFLVQHLESIPSQGKQVCIVKPETSTTKYNSPSL